MTRLPKVLLAAVFVFGLVILFSTTLRQVHSVSDHVMISEIQIAGNSSNDEFVELYNPTDAEVNLEGWRLRKTSASGASTANLASTIYGSIPAHGYFLIAHPNYDGAAYADLLYTATSSGIAANNHVILYNDAGVTEVDRVGLGTATLPEGSLIDNPVTHGGVERQSCNRFDQCDRGFWWYT